MPKSKPIHSLNHSLTAAILDQDTAMPLALIIWPKSSIYSKNN